MLKFSKTPSSTTVTQCGWTKIEILDDSTQIEYFLTENTNDIEDNVNVLHVDISRNTCLASSIASKVAYRQIGRQQHDNFVIVEQSPSLRGKNRDSLKVEEDADVVESNCNDSPADVICENTVVAVASKNDTTQQQQQQLGVKLLCEKFQLCEHKNSKTDCKHHIKQYVSPVAISLPLSASDANVSLLERNCLERKSRREQQRTKDIVNIRKFINGSNGELDCITATAATATPLNDKSDNIIRNKIYSRHVSSSVSMKSQNRAINEENGVKTIRSNSVNQADMLHSFPGHSFSNDSLMVGNLPNYQPPVINGTVSGGCSKLFTGSSFTAGPLHSRSQSCNNGHVINNNSGRVDFAWMTIMEAQQHNGTTAGLTATNGQHQQLLSRDNFLVEFRLLLESHHRHRQQQNGEQQQQQNSSSASKSGFDAIMTSSATESGSTTPVASNSNGQPTTTTITDAVLALRGVTLKEAVQGICEKRHVNLEQIHLFLESSNTPLPWETDTSFLGGLKLYARAKKDDSPFSKSPLFVNGSSPPVIIPPRKESLGKNDRKLSFGGGFPMSKKKPEKLTLTAPQPPSSSSTVADSSSSASLTNGSDHRLLDCGVQASASSADTVSMTNGVVGASSSPLVSTPSELSANNRKERSRSQGRLSQIFPNPFKADDRLEMLEKLTHFQEHGLLTAAGLLQDVNLLLCQNAFQIEEKWQDIVKNIENLSKKQQEQQEVLWELVTTELNYIKKSCCIVELQACVSALQTDGFLVDIDVECVFGNILDICRANLRFWLQCLHPLLQYSRQTGEPLDPTKLEAGFQNLERLFNPYIPYCLHHVEMLCYIRRKQKESELFREFALWVQSRRVFGRLHLTDLLAKPMQRLTKYPLLLKAILKNTSDVASRDSLSKMIDTAEEFASKVNIELCHKQHYDALCSIMQCIESYEPIEVVNDELDKLVKEYSYVDLTAPMPGCRPKIMRQLILRGDLKLREAYSKIDVVCFLFTDMFMVCKSIVKKGDRIRVKVIRPPYHLDRVIVKQLRETAGFAFVYLNEFNLPSAASTFLAHSGEEAFKWLEHFHMAKEEYNRVRTCDDYLSSIIRTGSRFTFESNGTSTFAPSISSSASNGGLMPSPASSVSRKSSAHLAPNSNQLQQPQHQTVLNQDGPHRRISMGAVDQKDRKKPVPTDVSHRKSNSMDNSVVCAAAVGAFGFGPLRGKASSQDDALLSPIRDSHSASCLAEPNGGSVQDSLDVPSSTNVDECNQDDESLMGRLRANSVELIKRLSPNVHRKSWDSLTADAEPARASTPLSPEPNADKLSEPYLDVRDETSPRSPSATVALDRKRSNSPFRKSKVPSPIFFLGVKQQAKVAPCESDVVVSMTSAEETSLNNKNNNNNEKTKNNNEAASNKSGKDKSPASSNRRLERRYHTADGIEEMKPKKPQQPGSILKRFSWSTPAQHLKAKQMSDVTWRKQTVGNSTTTMSSDSFCSSSGVSSSSSQLNVSSRSDETTTAPLGGAASDLSSSSDTPTAGSDNMTYYCSTSAVKLSTDTNATKKATSAYRLGVLGRLRNVAEQQQIDYQTYHPHHHVSTVTIGDATSAPPSNGGGVYYDEEDEAELDDNFDDTDTDKPYNRRYEQKIKMFRNNNNFNNLHYHYDDADNDGDNNDSLPVGGESSSPRPPNIPIIETEPATPLSTPVSLRAPKLPAKEDLLRFILEGNLEASDV